jgi:Ca2+-binding RTX toxin-like protein
MNPSTGTIYGKVGFTAADDPIRTITIKATDNSGSFATTTLTLNVLNVAALMGTTSSDTLIAGKGDDRFWGNGGADTLTGGEGADVFNFNASPLLGLSTITDFVPGLDKLRLSLKVFPSLGSLPTNISEALLNTNLFETGYWLNAATKTTTRVFFNQSNSTLYYDADGLGGIAPTPIVKLSGVTSTLHSSDIFIFN